MSRFYDRRSWRRTSAAYLATHPLCVACADAGKVRGATQVDHITPLVRNEEPYNWSGLQGLCDAHHAEKTLLIEQGKHLRGAMADGTPRDPLHWWRQA